MSDKYLNSLHTFYSQASNSSSKNLKKSWYFLQVLIPKRRSFYQIWISFKIYPHTIFVSGILKCTSLPNTQCGNLRKILPLTFHVKSKSHSAILTILMPFLRMIFAKSWFHVKSELGKTFKISTLWTLLALI